METIEAIELEENKVDESSLPFRLEKKGQIIQIIDKRNYYKNKKHPNYRSIIELQLFDKEEILSFRNVKVNIASNKHYTFLTNCFKESFKYLLPFK